MLLNWYKSTQSLANACNPEGMPILYQVVRSYSSAYDDKEKEFLGHFFDFLLLNGADYTKRFTARKSTVKVTYVYHFTGGTDYGADEIDTVCCSIRRGTCRLYEGY